MLKAVCLDSNSRHQSIQSYPNVRKTPPHCERGFTPTSLPAVALQLSLDGSLYFHEPPALEPDSTWVTLPIAWYGASLGLSESQPCIGPTPTTDRWYAKLGVVPEPNLRGTEMLDEVFFSFSGFILGLVSQEFNSALWLQRLRQSGLMLTSVG